MNKLALFSGLLFGLGVLLSGMTDPDKVLGFLNIAGAWDPSLLLVLVTAVLVAFVPMQLAQRRSKALLGDAIAFPDTRSITSQAGAGQRGVRHRLGHDRAVPRPLPRLPGLSACAAMAVFCQHAGGHGGARIVAACNNAQSASRLASRAPQRDRTDRQTLKANPS